MKKVLIANRGEVAIRLIHAVHELGMKAIWVASALDEKTLPHDLADQTILLKGDTLAETYLNGNQILEVARKERCDLLHPGFGFLSESSAFARAVGEAKILWVGPSPQCMEKVSSKVAAKQTAQSLKIPIVPWCLLHEEPSSKDFQQIEKEIGFPCLLKAVSGGGGKGQKIVEKSEDLASLLSSARREALQSFGDASVFVERLVIRPRHVEVQVFGDCDGKVHAFGERDCSVQRRFQKIIEESPAPGMTAAMRKKLEQYSVKIAQEVGYQSAGTVEFLWDLERDEVYFMEMNTRLQVEHGVTEERYGIDLVKMQLLTALGESIQAFLPQGEPQGHVIELRLYAEDPALHFLPQPGRVHVCVFPSIKGFRLETAIRSGDKIADCYDPMIGKLILTGCNRQEALQKAIHALEQTTVLGPTSNRDFLLAVLRHADFKQGGVSTSFVAEIFSSWKGIEDWRELALAIALAQAGPKQKALHVDPLPAVFSRIGFGRENL